MTAVYSYSRACSGLLSGVADTYGFGSFELAVAPGPVTGDLADAAREQCGLRELYVGPCTGCREAVGLAHELFSGHGYVSASVGTGRPPDAYRPGMRVGGCMAGQGGYLWMDYGLVWCRDAWVLLLGRPYWWW